MNLTSNRRARHAAIIVIAAALASTVGTGPAGVAGQEPLPEACALQERSPNYAHAIDPTCASNIAVEAARAEAATWPDFDPSDMTAEVAQTNAALEAATWPTLDPSDMTDEIAAYEAQQEAAISRASTAAANSPRMTQIAAEAGTGETVASSGNPFVL